MTNPDPRLSTELEKEEVSHSEHNESATPPAAFTPEEEKRVRRKADFVLLPMFCAIYALGFLDKTALTYASVMGIRTAAKLTTNQYAWLGSIYC
jgi:ACS family allantoate permease-like MFS transporter